MRKKIIAEGVEFIYSNEFEDSYKVEDYSLTNDTLELVEQDELKAICRVSLTLDNKIRRLLYVDYLFWFDDTNLVELDLKVDLGIFSDADFTNSMKMEFVKNLFCHYCKSKFRGALAFDGTPIYLGQWHLANEKLNRLRESNKFKKCPNCSSNLRIGVVHIFE
jgi:hypothetical protein